jgi:hypothetical protein
MVINANTKTPTTILMVAFVEAKYGKISQISRRKTEISFLNTRRAIPHRPQFAPVLRPIALATLHCKTGYAWLLNQNLMGSADCEPTFGLVPGRPRHVYLQGGPSSPPELGPFLSRGEWCWRGGAARWVVALSAQASGGRVSLLAL